MERRRVRQEVGYRLPGLKSRASYAETTRHIDRIDSEEDGKSEVVNYVEDAIDGQQRISGNRYPLLIAIDGVWEKSKYEHGTIIIK